MPQNNCPPAVVNSFNNSNFDDGSGDDDGDGLERILKPLQNHYQRLTFRTKLPCGSFIKWRTIFNGETLYVALPDVVFPEGSREAFISLLEIAEEKLKSRSVVVVFNSKREDCSQLIRTFMFLGFTLLAPTSPLFHADLKGNICLLYSIE